MALHGHSRKLYHHHQVEVKILIGLGICRLICASAASSCAAAPSAPAVLAWSSHAWRYCCLSHVLRNDGWPYRQIGVRALELSANASMIEQNFFRA